MCSFDSFYVTVQSNYNLNIFSCYLLTNSCCSHRDKRCEVGISHCHSSSFVGHTGDRGAVCLQKMEKEKANFSLWRRNAHESTRGRTGELVTSVNQKTRGNLIPRLKNEPKYFVVA